MMRRALVFWIIGLVTAVPYATYYLLFEAPRQQYALLITFILFWIFGFWSLAGPLIALVKVRRVFRRLEQASSREELLHALRSPEAREVAIEQIASDNHIPKFLATRVVDLLISRLPATGNAGEQRPV